MYLYFNCRDEFLRLDVEKIVYFESDGNYTDIAVHCPDCFFEKIGECAYIIVRNLV